MFNLLITVLIHLILPLVQAIPYAINTNDITLRRTPNTTSDATLPFINFTPFSLNSCQNSENPFAPNAAKSIKATQGACINAAYAFSSYVISISEHQAAKLGNEGLSDCILTVLGGTDCFEGDGSTSELLTVLNPGFESCVIPGMQAQSLYWSCGPVA